MDRNIDIKQLRAFIAVAKKLHFARAGESLGISQSSVSQQIKALETEVDTPLFDRTTRAVKLTPAGEEFLKHAEKGLALIDSASRMAALTASGIMGELKIGFITAAIVGTLPDALSQFRELHSDVTLHLRHMSSASIIEEVLAQKLDLGFVRTPIREPALYSYVISREGMVAVVRRDNPLAVQASLTLLQLEFEPLIQHNRQPEIPFQTKLYAACQQSGFLPNFVQETPDTTGIVGLVAAGVGSAILPASISNFARHPNVVFIPIPELENMAEIAFICRQEEASSHVKRFLLMLEQMQ